MDTENKPPQEAAADSIVLEEEIDPNYVPSEAEVVEYAKWLGMDLEKDHDLFWIAREGLMAPLPKDWKPCRTKDTEDIYYFNFTTGDSTWDHPCDGYYKRLYEEEKKKKETVIKESGDQNRSKAKQDVEQLLGKADKKKKKRAGSGDLGSIDMVKALPAPLGLHKKALPDISGPGRLGSAQSLGALGPPQLEARELGAGKQLPKATALTASLDGPRLSSFGSLPSHSKPLGSVGSAGAADDSRASSRPSSAPADGARAEAKESDRASHDQKHTPVQEDDDKEADRELGKLNVTAALNTKSRTLQGPSAASSATAVPSRSSQLAAVDDRDEEYSSRGKAERRGDESRRDDKDSPDSRPRSRSESRTQPTADDAPSPVLPGSSSASLQVELQRLREKCADLERKVEESEGRVADYRTSYANAKDELVALERRYETSQSQWKEKLRALEVERDAAESERRRLKFELLDLSERGPADVAAPPRATSDDITVVKELQQELRSAQAALARSAATHAELHAQMVEAEERSRNRLADTESRRAAAVSECDRLTAALEEVKRKVNVASEPLPQSSHATDTEELLSELVRLKDQVAAREAENAKIAARLSNEQARCAGLLEQIRTMGTTGEARTRSLQDENSALTGRIDELRATLLAATTELDSLRARAPAEAALLQRAEVAEALHQSTEKLLKEQLAREAALRRDMAEKERKQAEEQEHILSLQAERNQNQDSERGAQFDAYVSQATAVRKSLKSEIERLKSQVQELETEKAGLKSQVQDIETEKASLVTQLTRQDTTLQFAKKELNDVAALRESSRQLETEKQQLTVQLESAKDGGARASAQLAELNERYDQLTASSERDEETRRELSEENTRLRLAVETEKSVVAQKEKKIKSYQEELLQLQRRLAETTAVQASSPLFFSAATASLDSPVAMRQSSEIGDLQAKLTAAESAIEHASAECIKLRAQVDEGQAVSKRLQSSVDQLRGTCSALQAQLESKAAELESSRQSLAAFLTQQERPPSTAASGTAAVADASASLLQELTRKVSQVEGERSALANQVRDLRSQVLSAELSLELQSSSTKIAEAEALSYKEKWVATERDLSELRMQHTRAASAAEFERTSLQSQLSELQAINDVNARSASELRFSRQESSNLRVALSEKEGKLASALEELVALRLTRAPAVSADGGAIPAPPRPTARAPVEEEAARPPLPADPHHHHIVTLSMEVGRQQANMQRMEEHIRNTERLLLEFRGRAQKVALPSSDDSVLPSAIRTGGKKGVPAEAFSSERMTADSPESVSLLPERSKREALRARALSDSDSSVSPLRTGASAAPAAPSVSKDWVAALMRQYDLHEHDGATVRSSDREGGNDYARATAVRVLAEGKSRVKREGKFVKELQARCVAAKATLMQDQAAVKGLKSMWRSGKGRGERGAATLSTESINAITVQLNVSVDELRDAQSLAKSVEKGAKSLSQSLQYLEEILGVADSERQAQRLLQVTRQVQQKCVDSAADCATYVSASRGRAAGGKAVSWTPTLQASPKRKVEAERPPRASASAAVRSAPVAADFMFEETSRPMFTATSIEDVQHTSLAHSSSGNTANRREPPSHPQPFLQPPPRSYSAPLGSIQSSQERSAILREQIHRITERQGLSQQICEKHAGWLDNLHREISSVSHSYPRPVTAVAQKENGSQPRPSRASISSASVEKEGVTDFALQYEARASLSNSRRAFGDLQNRTDVPAAAAPGAGVLSDAYFTF